MIKFWIILLLLVSSIDILLRWPGLYVRKFSPLIYVWNDSDIRYYFQCTQNIGMKYQNKWCTKHYSTPLFFYLVKKFKFDDHEPNFLCAIIGPYKPQKKGKTNRFNQGKFKLIGLIGVWTMDLLRPSRTRYLLRHEGLEFRLKKNWPLYFKKSL